MGICFEHQGTHPSDMVRVLRRRHQMMRRPNFPPTRRRLGNPTLRVPGGSFVSISTPMPSDEIALTVPGCRQEQVRGLSDVSDVYSAPQDDSLLTP